MTTRFGLLVTLIALLPAPAAAQISGRVLSDGGRAIADVRVEAWSGSDRLAVTTTDEDGRFEFVKPIADLTRSLYLYRYGYVALRPDVSPTVREYTLRMTEDPVRLDGIVVDVAQPLCLPDEDREARRIWEAVADRYDPRIAELGIATYFASAIVSLPVSELGPVDVERPGAEQRGSAPLFRASWQRRVARSGYARRLSAASPDGMFVSWGYPPLEADFASHFVDEVFGELHRFTVEEETDEGWTLRFCPKNDGRPSIRGILKIASDTTLQYAEWLFDTPEPQEGAGGRVHYSRADTEGLRLPLAAEGMFWRQETEGGRYRERYQSYEGWIVSPGDSVPFLPVRDAKQATESR